MTQDEIGCLIGRLKGGSKLRLTGSTRDAGVETVVITWLGYGQFLREEGANRTRPIFNSTNAFAIDDQALHAILRAEELRPGRPIESVIVTD